LALRIVPRDIGVGAEIPELTGLPGPLFRARIDPGDLTNAVVETSTNLSSWTELFAVGTSGNAFEILDSHSPDTPMRFFRARAGARPPLRITQAYDGLSGNWVLQTTSFSDISVSTNRVLRLGYNADEGDPHEHTWEMRFESDYASDAGDRLVEWYLSHKDLNGAFQRPIMVQVSRLSGEITGRFRGTWGFGNGDVRAVMTVRESPYGGVGIGIVPTTNLFEVFRPENGDTLFLGGTARNSGNDAALNFFAFNDTSRPTYARIGLNVKNASPGSEAGELLFWTAEAGQLKERARLLANGRLGLGVSLPRFTLDIAGPVRLQRDSVLHFGGTDFDSSVALSSAANGILDLNGHLRLRGVDSLLFGAEGAGAHDTRLFRSDAESLGIDGSLTLYRDRPEAPAVQLSRSGGGPPLWQLVADGSLEWQNEQGARDVSLRREATGVLAVGRTGTTNDLVVHGTTSVRLGRTESVGRIPAMLLVQTVPASAPAQADAALWSRTIPRGTLTSTGQSLALRIAGTNAPYSGAIALSLSLGASQLLQADLPVSDQSVWIITGEIITVTQRNQLANFLLTARSLAGENVHIPYVVDLQEDLDTDLSLRLQVQAPGPPNAVAIRSVSVEWRPEAP
jgi:hypothetical protein